MEQKNITLILFTLAFGTVLGGLNAMMFNVALPTMVTYFNVPLSKVQWLTSGYMLAAGSIIPASGFLGDRFGYKRVFSLCLTSVLVLSIVGSFAWCIEALIVVRFLFGLTAGLLAPLSLTMMYRILPVSQQPTAASTWGVANFIGAILPTVLSGLILSVASWKFLLLFNIPFVVFALLLSLRFVPQDAVQNNSKLDFLGLVLLSSGSFVLLFTFSNLSRWGFTIRFLFGLCFGFALLGAYVLKNKNNETAILNLKVFQYSRYVAAFATGCINTVAITTVAFLTPLFLQNGLGISPLVTGLVMLPCSICSVIAMPVARKYYGALGEKRLATIGLAIVIIGSTPFLFVTPATSIILVIVALCIRSCGISAYNLVVTNAQMAAIPTQLSGHASSLTNWSHQMITALLAGVVSNVIDLRLLASQATTIKETAVIYTTTTNMIMAFSCILLASMIPGALKFFRGKGELHS